MITYTDALFAFVVLLHVCGLVVTWALWREIVGVRAEVRIRADEQEARDGQDREEARANARALGKLLAPVVRPPARPVRGFLGHRPTPSPTEPPREPEGDGDATEELGAAVVVVYWPGRGEDAERTVREVAS